MGIAKYLQRKARSASKLVRMDRLRRSLRESFRRKKEHVPECSKPHQWQADEVAVRSGTCNFPVKYLGCVEVFESRGMQVCEEALKVLRNSRRRPIKGILYVTGDGLRVVDDETKGLIVDQTIEKVSFCAPDRNHDKGFSYICRDGTTRRWMCHGFLAVKDSGERLSHAVGCAFAACLERKQKRDKECGVTMTFDPNNSTFTRSGSFRQTSLTERMQDPQDCKPADDFKILPPTNRVCKLPQDPPPVKSVHNPFAIERPHATPMMLQRQGSFRGFTQLGQSSPFKRQLSLRLNDLPSTLERQRSLSLESPDFSRQNGPDNTAPLEDDSSSPQLPPRVPRNRLHSLPNAVNMSPILESSPVVERQDTISAMCQQVSQGLSLLSNTDDPFLKSNQSQQQSYAIAPPPAASETSSQLPLATTCTSGRHSLMNGQHAGPSLYAHTGQTTYNQTNHVVSSQSYTQPLPAFNSTGMNHQQYTGPPPTYTVYSSVSHVTTTQAPTTVMSSKAFTNAVDANHTNPWSESSESGTGPSAAEEWLASAGSIPKSSSNPSDLFATQFNGALSSVGPVPTVRRAPHLAHLRSQSVGECPAAPRTEPWTNGTAAVATTALRDPFDAEWAALAAARSQPSTNPFQQNSMKAFEVQM